MAWSINTTTWRGHGKLPEGYYPSAAVLDDLADFVQDHHAHGRLVGDFEPVPHVGPAATK